MKNRNLKTEDWADGMKPRELIAQPLVAGRRGERDPLLSPLPRHSPPEGVPVPPRWDADSRFPP